MVSMTQLRLKPPSAYRLRYPFSRANSRKWPMWAAFSRTNRRGMTPSQRLSSLFHTRSQTVACSFFSKRRLVAFLAASVIQHDSSLRRAFFSARSFNLAATQARRTSSACGLFAVAGAFWVLRMPDERPVRRSLPLWNGLMLRFVFMLYLQFSIWLCQGLAISKMRFGDLLVHDVTV